MVSMNQLILEESSVSKDNSELIPEHHYICIIIFTAEALTQYSGVNYGSADENSRFFEVYVHVCELQTYNYVPTTRILQLFDIHRRTSFCALPSASNHLGYE
ncbi:hypothetical protein E2542_SST31307 [Spatholobus suberectus]|nr:hypothetical protein E2542_SST31307 [Spatholobus suberectus]